MSPDLPAAFPPELRPLASEVRTFFHELPRLLNDGEEGRFVLVKGDVLHGTWDTQLDAIQAGRDRFTDGIFLAQRIDRRFLVHWEGTSHARSILEPD